VERIVVDPISPDPEVIARVAARLRDGALVAFPTETVYGLGGNALDPVAVARIYAAKGRPSSNPLILHVPDTEAARRLVSRWPATASALAAAFWPGPLTMVLPRGSAVPAAVAGGLDTVGVRVPGHPVALALLRAAAVPVAAPSANPSARVSPTTAEHVERGLGRRVDLVLDGGATPSGIESTVVDLSGGRPALLRPGALSADEIEAVVGPLERPTPGPGGPTPSPGMQERHYAPEGDLRIMEWDPLARTAAATAAVSEVREGGRVGALLLHPLPGVPVHHAVPMPRDPHAYARLLYATLHALDDLGCTLILVDPVPLTPGWEGVRDRLVRASRRG
jgi:L-threonylcarbamoyladenylate synthase